MNTIKDEKERIIESAAEILWLDIILAGHMTTDDVLHRVREILDERSSPHPHDQYFIPSK